MSKMVFMGQVREVPRFDKDADQRKTAVTFLATDIVKCEEVKNG